MGRQLDISDIVNGSTVLGLRPTKFEKCSNSISMVPLRESFNLSKVLFPHLENRRRKLGNIYLVCVNIKGKNQYLKALGLLGQTSVVVVVVIGILSVDTYIQMVNIKSTLCLCEQMMNEIDLKCSRRILDWQ